MRLERFTRLAWPFAQTEPQVQINKTNEVAIIKQVIEEIAD